MVLMLCGIFLLPVMENASLMATEKNHILTPLDLFDWASKNICNIDFIYISSEEITEHCQKKQFE